MSLRFPIFFFLFTLFSLPAFSQDLLASQAPIDRRLRAVDSVALRRVIRRKEKRLDEELYSTWNTERAHPYTEKQLASALPDSVKIDLRGFCMPTPSRNVTSRYGYRPAFRRVHKGLDIKVYTGDTIVAAFDGKARVVRYDAGGYGYYVVLRHHNGLETIYGHLSKQLVTTNQEVKAGEPIGLGGNTGRSFGSHLHFETRVLGQPIDPELLFDFPQQDVTGDFYVFHRPAGLPDANAALLANNDDIGEHDADPSSALPAAKSKKRGSRDMASNSSSPRYYKVRKGDSLYTIARRLGTTVKSLERTNRLNSRSKIRAGQILRY